MCKPLDMVYVQVLCPECGVQMDTDKVLREYMIECTDIFFDGKGYYAYEIYPCMDCSYCDYEE